MEDSAREKILVGLPTALLNEGCDDWFGFLIDSIEMIVKLLMS
jgi:hypothetical protein